MEQEKVQNFFTPFLDQIFAELPAVTTDAKAWMSYNGKIFRTFSVRKEAWTDGQEVRVYDSRKNFIGLLISIVHRRSCSILRKCFDPEAEKIEK